MAPPSPSYTNDHRVKIMDIQEDEEAVIRVRTKHHVTLVFSRMTLEVFEKDGVIYTRQEVNGGSASDTESEGEDEYDQYLETQPFDYQDKFTTPVDAPMEPVDVVGYAGGSFGHVNEKHASRLEGFGIEQPEEGLDVTRKSLAFDEAGETQIEPSESQVQFDREFEEHCRKKYGVLLIPDTQYDEDD